MANYTPNYQLHQWEPQDPFLRTDFNQDLSKIDTALVGLVGKGQALEATLAAHASAIAKLGNCKINYSSYVGNGGSSRNFTFPGTPLLICIMGGGADYCLIGVQGTPYVVCSGEGGKEGGNATWSGSSVTFVNSNNRAHFICNTAGRTYFMIILMDAQN